MRRFVHSTLVVACALTFVPSGVLLASGPMPMGPGTTTISYQTDAGPVSVSGSRDFNGAGPTDATTLIGSDNIRIFNSFNSFGRRMIVPGAVGPDESVISHAFYKTNNDGVYFPGLVAGGEIRLDFENLQFDRPTTIEESTIMLHALWSAEQVDLIDDYYIHLHNHHTARGAFREVDDFNGLIFFDLPQPNYVLGDADLQWEIVGNGTDTLSMSVTFPYTMLANMEEDGQVFSPGLPAPQGFLEPFHFHIEYVATPEPVSLALLGVGGLLVLRRRRTL